MGMKALLTDLDTAVVKWVTAENAHRLCLTAFEKKSMEESEVRVCVHCIFLKAHLQYASPPLSPIRSLKFS